MGKDPIPSNPAETATEVAISTAVKLAESAAANSIEVALETALPVFAIPVIKQIADATIEELLSVLGDQISVGLQQFGTFIVIDTQVSAEKSGISKALADLMLAEKSGDQNEITKAIAAYQKAQSALVNSDGASVISP